MTPRGEGAALKNEAGNYKLSKKSENIMKVIAEESVKITEWVYSKAKLEYCAEQYDMKFYDNNWRHFM